MKAGHKLARPLASQGLTAIGVERVMIDVQRADSTLHDLLSNAICQALLARAEGAFAPRDMSTTAVRVGIGLLACDVASRTVKTLEVELARRCAGQGGFIAAMKPAGQRWMQEERAAFGAVQATQWAGAL